jgi:hypothetical protein
MGGVAKRNLEMFQNMVGQDNMGNIKLVTTMWDCIGLEQGQVYLDELVRDFWNVMIMAGAQVDRCDDAAQDGKRIIQSILKTSPLTLQLQMEIEDGRQLQDTATGKFVMDQLDELQKKYEKEMKELREQLASTTSDRDREAAIRSEYEEKLRKQGEAAEQARKLLETDVKKLQEEVEELKKKKRGSCIIL